MCIWFVNDVLFECENNSVDEEDGEWWEYEEDDEWWKYEEDGDVIRDSCSDEDSDDECLIKLDSDFDENSNCIVFKIIICLIMNWIVCCELSGIEEIIWDF